VGGASNWLTGRGQVHPRVWKSLAGTTPGPIALPNSNERERWWMESEAHGLGCGRVGPPSSAGEEGRCEGLMGGGEVLAQERGAEKGKVEAFARRWHKAGAR